MNKYYLGIDLGSTTSKAVMKLWAEALPILEPTIR